MGKVKIEKYKEPGLELVISVILMQYAKKGLTQEALMEAVRAGVADAREHYNPTEEIEYVFALYSMRWIRQRILQAINEKKKQDDEGFGTNEQERK